MRCQRWVIEFAPELPPHSPERRKDPATGTGLQIAEYDYSTLRKMITGTIRLQPRAIELMAQALEVPPETFLEYQVFQIEECLEAHPEICPYIYRTVLTRARIMDELEPERGSSRRGVRSRAELELEDEAAAESDTEPKP